LYLHAHAVVLRRSVLLNLAFRSWQNFWFPPRTEFITLPKGNHFSPRSETSCSRMEVVSTPGSKIIPPQRRFPVVPAFDFFPSQQRRGDWLATEKNYFHLDTKNLSRMVKGACPPGTRRRSWPQIFFPGRPETDSNLRTTPNLVQDWNQTTPRRSSILCTGSTPQPTGHWNPSFGAI
jgi:hypothetical protein